MNLLISDHENSLFWSHRILLLKLLLYLKNKLLSVFMYVYFKDLNIYIDVKNINNILSLLKN